jgi:hypothetical protein
MDNQDLKERIADFQTEVIKLGIRRLSGDLHLVFAVLHGTGTRGSLECSVDGLDILEADQQLLADHLRKMATSSK